MNLSNLIKGILNLQKKLDKKILPSQGLFYKDDFEIFIKKADISDIIEYEHGYIKDDVSIVINKIKLIVEKNTYFSQDYSFNDIKSIDIIFIFLEIVRFTKGESIKIKYFNEDSGREDFIEFGSNHFNYFTIDDDIMKYYNSIEKTFEIDGYKYTIPTIGIENSLTNYLISKSYDQDALKYNKLSYDFTYFLGTKNHLSFSEIDNLIQIFNFDMDESEKIKVKKIIKKFLPIQKYSLKRGDKIIDMNSKIDLEKIWR